MATQVSINQTSRIQTFFSELENQKSLLTNITDLHKTLTTQLKKIDETLNAKSEALDFKIKAFSENTKNALENLRTRETEIPDRQSSLEKLVMEQKAAAIAEIERTEELGDLSHKSVAEALKVYSRRMHAGELIRFLVAKRNHQMTLKAEIPAAATESIDPMRLVLDAVEEFVQMKLENAPGIGDTRWACSLLIQSVVPIKEVVGAGSSLRKRAAEVLEKWKGALDGREGTGGVAGTEADMFLQMVRGFGLKEKFDDEFLRKLVVEFANREDMPKIAVALGFGEKLVDIINELIKNGKEVEAVYFASESGLTEQFPPVSLLKSSLQNANSISKKESANDFEVDAIRSIVKCVEDHKLESHFNIEDLKKRIESLERGKAEKEIAATSTSKSSNKRPNSSIGPFFRPPKAGRFSNESSSSFHYRNPCHSQLPHVPSTRYSGVYSYSNTPGYIGPQAQSPVALSQQQYAYMSRGTGAYGEQGGSHTYQPTNY